MVPGGSSLPRGIVLSNGRVDGIRGAPQADLDALASAVARLSAIATDLGDVIEAIDVNPMICSPSGCLAVDALVIPRTSG